GLDEVPLRHGPHLQRAQPGVPADARQRRQSPAAGGNGKSGGGTGGKGAGAAQAFKPAGKRQWRPNLVSLPHSRLALSYFVWYYSNSGPHAKKERIAAAILSLCIPIPLFYFSSTDKIPMGHALAQIPQAIHLLTVAAPGARTITCMGQASTHLPQPTHFFLST